MAGGDGLNDRSRRVRAPRALGEHAAVAGVSKYPDLVLNLGHDDNAGGIDGGDPGHEGAEGGRVG